MKLNDLLAVINEHEEVLVSQDGLLVDKYNGRDAIDPRWGDCEVLELNANHFTRTLLIEIKEE